MYMQKNIKILKTVYDIQYRVIARVRDNHMKCIPPGMVIGNKMSNVPLHSILQPNYSKFMEYILKKEYYILSNRSSLPTRLSLTAHEFHDKFYFSMLNVCLHSIYSQTFQILWNICYKWKLISQVFAHRSMHQILNKPMPLVTLIHMYMSTHQNTYT